MESVLFAIEHKIESDLIYSRIAGGRIKLPAGLIYSFRNYVQHGPDKPEAGGVILGRYILDTEDVVIDKLTYPMKGDKATRTTFFRKKSAHQAVIDHEWLESQHTCTYLGEWHTHPEPYPTPSCIDIINWKRKLKRDVVDSNSLFFFIVGTKEIRMWEGCRASGKISLLTVLK